MTTAAEKTMLFGLSALQRADIEKIFQQCPQVQQAILFGSRAKGTQHTRSDIDIALTGAALDRHQLATLRLLFDESAIPFQVDLQLLNEIKSPALLEHIQRVGQVIYQARVG